MLSEQEKENILKMNEVESYFLIDECGSFIWRMNHEMSHGRIPFESHQAINEDIENVRVVQKFTADNLTRFGVDPESVKDRENGDYWKWFTFWYNWKKSLTDEQWMEVSRNDGSIDKYLPEGSWKNHRAKLSK